MIGSNSGPLRWKPPMIARTCVHAGESLGVAADVDDARVPAAGQHDQSASGTFPIERLVVEDQRVRFPARRRAGPGGWGTPFEVGPAVDLTGDQHRPVEQERRAPLLDDVEPGVLQRAAAGGRAAPSAPDRESPDGGGVQNSGG